MSSNVGGNGRSNLKKHTGQNSRGGAKTGNGRSAAPARSSRVKSKSAKRSTSGSYGNRKTGRSSSGGYGGRYADETARSSHNGYGDEAVRSFRDGYDSEAGRRYRDGYDSEVRRSARTSDPYSNHRDPSYKKSSYSRSGRSGSRSRSKNGRSGKNSQNKRRMKIIIGVEAVLILVGAVVFISLLANILKSPVKKKLVLEVGSPITAEAFLDKKVKSASFVTDINSINLTKPGTSKITLEINGKNYDSELVLQDTVAPTGVPAEVMTPPGVLPAPEDCFESISDETQVTVKYEVEPEVSREGNVKAVLRLTDEGGNYTLVEVNITVKQMDNEPPKIVGVKDIVITEGETISYKKGVSVTDNMDENPTLEIDNSQVDANTPGEYSVIYTATDSAGNKSSVSATVTVKKQIPADEAEVYELAQKVLDSITDDSMSDMEVAFAIYRWTKSHIAYTGTSDKSSWVVGAKQAFTKYSGDCFNYFAAAKALYTVAGIENVDVVKSDTSHSRHYWSLINLGDGWYHVDCTQWTYKNDNLFMLTDEELETFSSAHYNRTHIYDGSLYPKRATGSVQSKVDYKNGVIKD